MASRVLGYIVSRPWNGVVLGIIAAYLCSCGIGCDGGAAVTKSAPGTSPVVQADDHDHDHDHAPATLADAVKQLTTIRDTIKNAFAKNDSEAAHGPLHDVGHVLEATKKLIDAAALEDKQKESAKLAVELLMSNFGKVDDLMHGATGAKYEDVSAKIDEAIKSLADLAAPKP